MLAAAESETWERLGRVLLDGVLAAVLLLTLAMLAMIAVRQPSRRRLLARLAVAGGLAILPLAAWSPWPRIDVLEWARDAVRGAAPRFFAIEVSREALGAIGFGYVLILTTQLLWLAFLRIWAPWRLLRRHASEPSAEARGLYESLPFEGKRKPRLFVSGWLQRPGLLGLTRPTIVIPKRLDRPEAQQSLRLALLHELAHAEAADRWFLLGGQLLQAVWFFLPQAWWIGSRKRLDQEFLADDRAAEQFGGPIAYASSLLELATQGPAAPARSPCRPQGRALAGHPGDESTSSASTSIRPAPAPAPAPSPALAPRTMSELASRILMLVYSPYVLERHAPAWRRRLAAALALLLTLMATRLSLAVREPGWAPPPPSTGETVRFAASLMEFAPSPQGPAPPHALPVSLPERFALRLEVWVESPEDWAEYRIMGIALGPAGSVVKPGWRLVELRREGERATLRAGDDPPKGVAEWPNGDPWLTIVPPARSGGKIRALELRELGE